MLHDEAGEWFSDRPRDIAGRDESETLDRLHVDRAGVDVLDKRFDVRVMEKEVVDSCGAPEASGGENDANIGRCHRIQLRGGSDGLLVCSRMMR